MNVEHNNKFVDVIASPKEDDKTFSIAAVNNFRELSSAERAGRFCRKHYLRQLHHS